MIEFPSGSNHLFHRCQSSWLDADCLPNLAPKVHLNVKEHLPVEQLTDDVSSLNLTWEFVGEDLLLPVSQEHNSYLSDIFPGAHSLQNICNSSSSVQDGSCAFCSKFLPPGDSTLDFYDGRLYCSTCHQNHQAVIPRDILENWDFSEKPVSFATKKFLDSISSRPLVNLSDLNPGIYAAVEELAFVRLQRRKLSLLWCHLTRCSLEAAQSLVASLAHRHYMICSDDFIDIYSTSDLIGIHSGELQEHLTAAMNRFALSHIENCSTCKMWTCICDSCGDTSRPIWPYMFDKFRRCSTPDCWRAMHVECLWRTATAKKSIAELDCTASFSEIHSVSTSKVNACPDGMDSFPLCSACRRNRAVAFSSNITFSSMTTDINMVSTIL